MITFRGIGALFGGCSGISYALSATIVKELTCCFDTMFLTLTRCILMAILSFVPVLFRRSKFWKVSAKDALKIIIISIGSLAITACFYGSTQLMDMSVSVTLLSTFPVFVAIFSRIFLHEQLQKEDIILIVACIIGVLMCTQPSFNIFVAGLNSTNFAVGCVLALIAAIVNGGCLVLFKTLDAINVMDFTFMETIISAIILLIYHAIIGNFPSFTLKQFLLICANGLCAWIASVLVFAGLKLDSAVLVSIGRSSEIVVAIIFNLIIFHVPVNVVSIIGSIIITAGILAPSIMKLYQETA